MGINLFLAIIFNYFSKYFFAIPWLKKFGIISNFKKDDKLNHDKNIFKYSEIILNEEKFNECMSTLGRNNQLTRDDLNMLHNFDYFFDKIENNYINCTLKKKLNEYHKSLKSLLKYTAIHFFRLRDHSDKDYYLYPDLKYESGEKESIYRKRQDELYEILDDCESKYLTYRKIIKKILLK